VERAAAPDYLDKARAVAAAALIAAGAAAIIGSFLDWVTLDLPPVVPPGELAKAQPYSGIETGDGGILVAAGAFMVVVAILLAVRRRSFYAWLAFVVSVVIGAIGVGNYRSAGDATSDLTRRMDIVGDPSPGIGLTLIAVAALIGIVGSLAGVAATPRIDST